MQWETKVPVSAERQNDSKDTLHFPKRPGILKVYCRIRPVDTGSVVPDGPGKYSYCWTGKISKCYTSGVLASALYIYLSGFSLFLLGFSVFMFFENRKFDDNQFTVKLLPPPIPASSGMEVSGNGAIVASAQSDHVDNSMVHLMPVQATALA